MGDVMKMNPAAPIASMFPHFEVLFSRPVETGHSIHGTDPGGTAIPTLSRQAGDFSVLSNNQMIDARSTGLCGGIMFTRSQCDGLKDGVPTLSVKPASESSK
jgi:hypothetical protein